MCQPVVQFCAGSTKPLIFAGSFLTLILALALASIGYSYNSLYEQLDSNAAQGLTEYFYLQLLAAAYLILVTALSSFAAYYDQKHSIRALAIITTVNVALATAAILFVPSGADLSGRFDKRLEEARSIYDFTLQPPNSTLTQVDNSTLKLLQSPISVSSRKRRFAEDGNNLNKPPAVAQPQTSAGASSATLNSKPKDSPLNKQEATRIWDLLQNQGCCGFRNSTEWSNKIPKSCCASADNLNGEYTCKEVDLKHQVSCADLLGTLSRDLLIILALIALINLYLATVTGVSTYRTFHYNEASQNAYS